MLTERVTAVDAQLPLTSAPRSVMWSVSQIAARDGVSKQAVSKKVKKLAESGLTVERDGAGNVKAVNVAEYDRLRGRTDDPAKAQAPPADTGASRDPESYNEAARQTKWLEAERRRIDLAILKGELIRLDRVEEAIIVAAGAMAKVCDRLPNAADDIAAAMTRGGVHAVRTMLKQLAFKQRTEIADALSDIADASPKEEAPDAPPEPPAEPLPS